MEDRHDTHSLTFTRAADYASIYTACPPSLSAASSTAASAASATMSHPWTTASTVGAEAAATMKTSELMKKKQVTLRCLDDATTHLLAMIAIYSTELGFSYVLFMQVYKK